MERGDIVQYNIKYSLNLSSLEGLECDDEYVDTLAKLVYDWIELEPLRKQGMFDCIAVDLINRGARARVTTWGLVREGFKGAAHMNETERQKYVSRILKSANKEKSKKTIDEVLTSLLDYCIQEIDGKSAASSIVEEERDELDDIATQLDGILFELSRVTRTDPDNVLEAVDYSTDELTKMIKNIKDIIGR